MRGLLLKLVSNSWFLWLLAWFLPAVNNQRGSLPVHQTRIEHFHDTLPLLYQQMDSMLRGRLDPGMVHTGLSAAVDYHDRLGNVLANDVVTPGGQIIPF